MNELKKQKSILEEQLKKKDPKFSNIDFDNAEDCLALHRAVARGEPLTRSAHGHAPLHFKAMFKHPLPVSDHRHQREANLRRVRSVALERQAAGAVAIRDAWVLEEIFMSGTEQSRLVRRLEVQDFNKIQYFVWVASCQEEGKHLNQLVVLF